MALNDRQEAFCREYIIDYNKTQAAIRAGYSKRTARSIGSENLTKPDILARVRELQDAKLRELALSKAFVITEIVETYRKCLELEDNKNALKALEMLANHLEPMDETDKKRDTSFIDALNSKAQEVWNEEEKSAE